MAQPEISLVISFAQTKMIDQQQVLRLVESAIASSSKYKERTRWMTALLGVAFVALCLVIVENRMLKASSLASVPVHCLDSFIEEERQVTSICERLDNQGFVSAASLWRQSRSALLEASRHPLDTQGVHNDWMTNVFDVLRPSLLERSLLSQFSDEEMQDLMTIVNRRLRDRAAPPLRVVVFGGSVTEGTQCELIPKEVTLDNSKKLTINGKQCAWPYRLQLLADRLIGEGVIEITNVAVGGTGSILALPVLDYGLYPPRLIENGGPDIIINAYSINDNLPKWTNPNRGNTTATFEHFAMNVWQQTAVFVDTAKHSKPCRRQPSVIYWNENIGNQNELLLGEDIRNEAVRLLAEQLQFGYISPAHAIQSLVYADQFESVFSPGWYSRQQRITNGHFQMPGHQYAAWTTAYAALRATVDYCARIHERQDDKNQGNALLSSAALSLQDSLAPPLTTDTMLDKLPADWGRFRQDETKAESDFCHSGANLAVQPCPFVFVASPAGTTGNAAQLGAYLNPFVVERIGWNWENDMRNGWQNKLGLAAHTPGAKIQLRINNINNRIRKITLHSLKSYGEKWQGSEAEFRIKILSGETVKHETSFRQTGIHDSETSIAYPFVLDLEDHAAEIGETVEMEIELVGGSEFKIIALMMCSR